MKITLEDIGANVEVTLADDDGFTVDKIYTQDHKAGLHFDEERHVSIRARGLFQWIEQCWAPPVIAGRLGYMHPYWSGRLLQANNAQQIQHKQHNQNSSQADSASTVPASTPTGAVAVPATKTTEQQNQNDDQQNGHG